MAYSRSTLCWNQSILIPWAAFQAQNLSNGNLCHLKYSVTTTIIQTLRNWGGTTHSCFLSCISCPWMLRLANLEVLRRREWGLSNIFTVYNANLCWEYFCLLMIGNKVCLHPSHFLVSWQKAWDVIPSTALFSLRELHCTMIRTWGYLL